MSVLLHLRSFSIVPVFGLVLQTDRKSTGSVEMVVRMTLSDVRSVLNWMVPQEYGLMVFLVSCHQSKYECPFDLSLIHTVLCHVQYAVCVSTYYNSSDAMMRILTLGRQ